MGEAIAELGWPRHTYVISSKFFWGIEDSVNTRNTLNRKYLLHAVDGSLRRLGLEFLDLIFCHRADPDTPIEETVRVMHEIITSGRALYWGTSEWSAEAISEAWDIADRHHLHKPVMEQPQYNLFERDKVEKEFAPLYDRIGLGLTTWSPLASGLLTGKYKDGIPPGSRAALPGYGWLQADVTDADANRQGARARGDRRRARGQPRAAFDCVVRVQSARLDGDHRRESRGPGPRKSRRARRHRPPHTRDPRAHRRDLSALLEHPEPCAPIRWFGVGPPPSGDAYRV